MDTKNHGADTRNNRAAHRKRTQVGSLSGWRCYISYADVGDISSQRGIDYNGEAY